MVLQLWDEMVFPHLPILYCMHLHQPVCYRYGVKRLVLQYWWHGTWAGLLSFNVRILVKQTTEWIPGIEVSVWKLLVSLIQSCMISIFHHCLLLNNSLLNDVSGNDVIKLFEQVKKLKKSDHMFPISIILNVLYS